MYERGEVHPIDLLEQLLQMMKQVNLSDPMNRMIAETVLGLMTQVSMAKYNQNMRISTMMQPGMMHQMQNPMINPSMMMAMYSGGVGGMMNPMLHPMYASSAKSMTTASVASKQKSESSSEQSAKKSLVSSEYDSSSYASESDSKRTETTATDESVEESSGTEEEDELGSESESSETSSSSDEDKPLVAVKRVDTSGDSASQSDNSSFRGSAMYSANPMYNHMMMPKPITPGAIQPLSQIQQAAQMKMMMNPTRPVSPYSAPQGLLAGRSPVPSYHSDTSSKRKVKKKPSPKRRVDSSEGSLSDESDD